MEDFASRTYGTSSGLDNRPLFGETSAKDRIINLVVGGLTSLLILVTLISAFVFPQLPPKPLNIFFAVCISLSSITACILIYWYRQGDLEPKFRNLIYYILFSIIMLCICANLYFHDVGKWKLPRSLQSYILRTEELDEVCWTLFSCRSQIHDSHVYCKSEFPLSGETLNKSFCFKELMLHLNISTTQVIFTFEMKNFYNVIAWRKAM